MGAPKRKRGRPKSTSDVPIAGSRALDRRSLVPLYFQLAVALSEKLEAGAWPPGARFATEREIEDEFGVSRSVVRHALDLLVGDGTIVRLKGAGAFITVPRHPLAICGVIKTLQQPQGVALEILTAHEEQPDPTLARLLKMNQRPTPVAHVTAVLRVDEDSVGLVDSYSVVRLVPGLLPAVAAVQGGALRPALGSLQLTRASVPIELTHFGDWGAGRVGVSAGDPALRGTLLQFGRPNGRRREQLLELAHLVYRADNVQLSIELGQAGAPAGPAPRTQRKPRGS
jgi:DNA-binding GntR family transcriptional regulator